MDVFNALQVYLQSNEPLIISIFGCFVYYCLVLVFHRFFGLLGIAVFFAMAIVGANMQVLKLSNFAGFSEPVALGTALFSATYFITDLVSEHYGRRAGLRLVWLGLGAMVLWSFITFHALSYRPLTPQEAVGLEWALSTHKNMKGLFTIVPSIALASMAGFAVSQINDVLFFDWLRKRTGGKMLFLRNNLSTFLSTLVDSVIFSVLAFRVFSANPIPWDTLFFSYIFGTYVLRLGFAVLDTPFIYLSKHRFFLPKNFSND